MRALLLALLCLFGCAPDFEEPSELAVWTKAKWLDTEDASEMWQAYGARIGCDWVDDRDVLCNVRGQAWGLRLTADPPVIRGRDGVMRQAGGYASYDRHRIYIWRGHPNHLAASAHELGHALMPVAGKSETEGHTRTGIMSDGALPVWTDEVLALCRAEGACR